MSKMMVSGKIQAACQRLQNRSLGGAFAVSANTRFLTALVFALGLMLVAGGAQARGAPDSFADLAQKLLKHKERVNEFERELLAVSLYEHGWLTQNAALIAEAEELYSSFPEDDMPYAVERAREAVIADFQS